MASPFTLNVDSSSPFWFVSFITPDGRRRRRSTKVPVAGGIVSGERLSPRQAKARAQLIALQLVQAELAKVKNGALPSLRQLFDLMLDGKLGRVSTATYKNAACSYRFFCEWLGVKANWLCSDISRAMIKDWVLFRRSQVRAKTCAKDLSAINAAFSWALDCDFIARNPCVRVSVPPDLPREKVLKEAFSWAEVQLLIDKAPDEWSSAVRCCIETYGQRLGDILALSWSQFDWDARVVNLITGKTARHMRQPMRDSFFAWSRERYACALALGGDAAIYVHPTLRLHSNPSSEFAQIVRMHGIGVVTPARDGRRRAWLSKTFHSLRAAVVTELHAKGVTQAMAMELVGHESVLVHQVYCKPTDKQLAEVGKVLPSL